MPENLPPEVGEARRLVARLTTERNKLLRTSAAKVADTSLHLSELRRIDERIAETIRGAENLVDPCDARPDVPLVLLPVRLETRFVTENGATVLKVRIYPDEVHVDALIRGTSPEEESAGRSYWTAVWADPIPENAWDVLVHAVGADRAEWVAHVTTPRNLAERAPDAFPQFVKTADITGRNVVARSLPDRFVVTADQRRLRSRATGLPIPRDLAMSPIPLEGDAPERVADGLTVPPGSEWLIDFAAAEKVGMAVTLPLAGGASTISRLFVTGTRSSATPAASADELEDLLIGHRFGDGFGLLAQGVPTNNADGERSPYNPARTPVPPSISVVTATPDGDATALARQLGIAPNLVASLVGDGSGEQDVARQVNIALWNPGWGSYLDRLDTQGVPGVVDAQRESARQLFRDHVRGRGVAPCIHVGAQPYGVLPVSDLSRWVPAAGDSTAGILSVVSTLLPRWLVAASITVPTVRPGDPAVDDTMQKVLGSSPVMQGLRVRPVLSDDVSAALLAALGIDHREFEAEKMSMAAPAFRLLGPDAKKLAVGSLHKEDRPLPLALASDRDGEFLQALVDGKPAPAVDSVLQALAALAWNSAELDVEKVSPASVLPHLLELVEFAPELHQLVESSISTAHSAAPGKLFGLVEQLSDAGIEAAGPSMLRHYEPIEALQSSLGEVALSAPVSARAKQVAGAALAGWFVAMGYRNEVRAAFKQLGKVSTQQRFLAVAEALDCSSHRLDAWATAVVSARRQRQSGGDAAAWRGCTIGAYGVVEGLSPATGSRPNGWLHAPSARHAIAAGMLRSSQLSHLPGGSGGGPFKIDLSSARVRPAVHIIDGVRQGQPLGALVGYQIERDLAVVRLARLQLSLRTIAPLVARRLHDETGDGTTTQESVAATNVVDGVLLLTRHAPGDPALRSALNKQPENPYLRAGEWPALTDAEWAAVTRIMASAADTIDAVADVMLSESVLQYAGGNPGRAAAAMDSMGTGAAPGDTIDILEGQDSGERLTHRVLALVGPGAAVSTWAVNRPRALVEPALEAWVAEYLGSPSTIVVADEAGARTTLDTAGWCALDFVFTADLQVLERQLRAALPALGDSTLAVRRDPAWPAPLRALGQMVPLATALRQLISGAQPVLPLDLASAASATTRTVGVDELLARVSRLVGGLDAAVAAVVPAVSQLPDGDVVDTPELAHDLSQPALLLEPYGVPLEPDKDRRLDLRWVRRAWETAEARSIAAQSALEMIDDAIGADTPVHLVLDMIQDAVGVVYGDGFKVVPLLLEGADPDALVTELTAPAMAAPAQSRISRFVADAGTVRPQMQRYADVRMLGGATGGAVNPLEVAQLAARADDGTPAHGTDHWLAGPLGPDAPWPATPVVHVVLDRLGSAEGPVAGLAVDGWVEDLPMQVGPKADPDDPRPGRARTGLAVHANSASARPPQSILCAVSPDGKRWTSDTIAAVIGQTLDLARARMVSLERLLGEGVALPAFYVRSSSLQGHSFWDFKLMAEQRISYVAMPYVSELKS